MESFFEEIYSCRNRNNCLEKYIDNQIPEPFIGSLDAKFAIIGANPGPRPCVYFEDFSDYANYYNIHYREKECSTTIREEDPSENNIFESGAYVESYKLLVNPDADVDEFYENTIVLNIVKCSTSESFRKIPKAEREQAKDNCIHYLLMQLENIKPLVILSHGRFACDTIIGLLKSGTNYKMDFNSSSSDFEALPMLMNDLSNHYLLGKDKSGQDTLFLFNKHLSYKGPAMNTLKRNIDKKKSLVRSLLK